MKISLTGALIAALTCTVWTASPTMHALAPADGPAVFPDVIVPADIVADCSVEVTRDLKAWIASVPDGSTLKFSSGSCYWVDYTLPLVDRHDLVLDGDGAIFQAQTTFPESPVLSRPMWEVIGGSNITFTDMTAKGTNPTPKFNRSRAFFPLFKFEGTQTGLIDNVTGLNSWGDFVGITPDTRGQGPDVFPDGITVKNSTTRVTGRHTVMCNGCDNVVVENNSFTDSGYQVFDIEVEAPNWHARNVSYLDNTIGGRVNLSVLVNAGIGADVTDITFSGNTMTSVPVSCSSPIYVLDTAPEKTGWVIENNYLQTLGAAAKLSGVEDVTFESNVVQLTNGGGCEEKGTAVRAANADVDIRRNDFRGFTQVLSANRRVTGVVCGNRLDGSSFDEPSKCR